ncbi:GNAT family N-acetyltransferase [Paenibacillus oenotherae]|uniref:GNAT family N-acetyltransferase n=1 Tax=Paenibacillus oenotherae TaxID=1435645 RepID=A0ABS7D5F3_9BACL|nr:GNAT family N-acetyltransferase [Paenibacillus oenotherae]MBW7475175.1 GNAT family N-acetyltransferase [Paenibacillus oenotherae]
MFNIRQYSTVDHEDVWRVHLLVISEAGVEPTHQHYHDIFHINEQYLNSGGEFLVGTGVDGTVVAMGGLKRLGGDRAEIKRLRVHPSYQKLGYGQQLLTQLEQRAVELGFRSIYLDTLTNQTGAQKLFLNNGYAPIGSANIDGFDVNLFEKTIG